MYSRLRHFFARLGHFFGRKWYEICSISLQAAIVALTAFTVFYYVEPIYQRDLLAEQVAELELEKSVLSDELASYRSQRLRLKELNVALEEKISDLRTNLLELREEQARLQAELKDRITQLEARNTDLVTLARLKLKEDTFDLYGFNAGFVSLYNRSAERRRPKSLVELLESDFPSSDIQLEAQTVKSLAENEKIAKKAFSQIARGYIEENRAELKAACALSETADNSARQSDQAAGDVIVIAEDSTVNQEMECMIDAYYHALSQIADRYKRFVDALPSGYQ